MPTSIKYSFDNIAAMRITEAPITFLMPISFVLLVAANTESPNKPMHPMPSATMVKMLRITVSFLSDADNLAKSWSRKEYSKGYCGWKDFHCCSQYEIVEGISFGSTRITIFDQ